MTDTTEVKAAGEGLIAVSDKAGELAGASTWWQLSGTCDAASLRAAGEAAGIAREHMPSDTSAKTALRRACDDMRDKRTLARSLPGGGWAIVRERVDTDPITSLTTLRHEVIAQVSLTPAGSLNFDMCVYSDVEDRIRTAYHTHRGELDAADLSAWLVNTAERLGAVALRDRGGVYFVPHASVATWRTVASVLRAQAPKCDVYELPTLKSGEAVRSIVAALTREAEGAAADMLAKIGSGELGERALRARGAECDALTTKLAAYEALLGTSLDAVKAQIGEVAAAAAAAALVAAAEHDAA